MSPAQLAPEATPRAKPALPVLPPLLANETPSSWIDRVAASYGTTRMDLWAFFEGGPVANYRDFRSIEIDNSLLSWPALLISSLPKKLLASLSKSASLMPSWSVEQRRRFAYCPLCFEELDAASLPLNFTHSWSAIYLTHCEKHGTQLLAWSSTQRSGQRHLSSTLSGAESGRPSLKKSADIARREDLELIRSFKNQLGASSSQVQADWKDHIDFERKIGRLMAGKLTKISSVDGQPILSSSPLFVQQLLRTIVATYNGPGGKRNPRFLAPADQQGWLWGVKQPLIRSFDERDEHLTIEMLTPESRRTVLWTARVMLSDKVRRFRHRQGFNATSCAKAAFGRRWSINLPQTSASTSHRWPPLGRPHYDILLIFH